MKIRSSSKVKEQPNTGTHLARVVSLCNLGLQPGFLYQQEMTENAYKMEITYELVNENMKDGRPFWVSEEVTNTDNEKGKLLQRCLATNVDIVSIHSIIDKPCMVSIKHNEKGYAKINNVAGVPAGIPVPPLRNPAVLFDIYSDTPNLDVFHSFPDFKKNKFTSALDFNETKLAQELAREATDESPF